MQRKTPIFSAMQAHFIARTKHQRTTYWYYRLCYWIIQWILHKKNYFTILIIINVDQNVMQGGTARWFSLYLNVASLWIQNFPLCVCSMRTNVNSHYMHCYIFLFVTTEVEMVDAVGLFDFRFVFGLYGGTVVAFAEVVLL